MATSEVTQDASSWYPGWKVRLIVRFEEYGDASPVAAKAPKTMVHKLKGTVSTRGQLAVTKESTDGGGNRFVLTAASTSAPGGPQKEDRSSDALTWTIGSIVPKQASWKQTGLRSADELRAVLKFLDFPFDPRTVRTCAVEFYLGCFSEEDFQAAQSGNVRGNADANQGNGQVLVLPDTWVDPSGRSRSNLRFQGWVDEFRVRHEPDEEGVVEITCRDNTKVFIDQGAPPKLVIAAAKPIDQAIAAYLANFPQFAGLGVEYRPGGVDVPTLGAALSKTAFKPELGPAPAKAGGAVGGGEKMSVWDYIVDVTGAIGHTVFVEGTTLVVQRVRTLTSSSLTARESDPYQPRTTPTGYRMDVRHFIYGRNVKVFEVARRYAKDAPTNVEVRCFGGETLIDFRGVEKAYRRWYSGPVASAVIADAEGARVLSGTPNHPVLTLRGWVPIGQLKVGDDLVCGCFPKGEGLRDPHVDGGPTEFGKLYDSLSNAFRVERRPTGHVDFHGDGEGSDVYVIEADGLLEDREETPAPEHVGELGLEASGDALRFLEGLRSRSEGPNDLVGGKLPAAKLIGSAGKGGSEFGTSSEPDPASFDLPSKGYSSLDEDAPNVPFKLAVELVDGSSFLVSTNKVLNVETREFAGHVYNLQTRAGWYLASGVIAHNCYSTRRKKTLVARFPLDGQSLVTDVDPGDGHSERKYLVWRVSGVEDEKVLRVIAQTVYETIGRNELEVSIETMDLASFGGGNLDPDVLDIRPGDAFAVLVDRNGTSTVAAVEDTLLVQESAREFLLAAGYSDGIADAYAKSYSAGGFQFAFRARGISADCDEESGVSLKVEGTNYVEVRADKLLPAGEEVTGSQTAGQRSTKVGQPGTT